MGCRYPIKQNTEKYVPCPNITVGMPVIGHPQPTNGRSGRGVPTMILECYTFLYGNYQPFGNRNLHNIPRAVTWWPGEYVRHDHMDPMGSLSGGGESPMRNRLRGEWESAERVLEGESDSPRPSLRINKNDRNSAGTGIAAQHNCSQ